MGGVDVIFAHETTALRGLILWRGPVHVEDLVAWTKRVLGMAMAVEAPAHSQGRRLPRQRHPIDRAMTGGAAHALGDVNAMVEVDVIGKHMDPLPANGFVVGQAFSNRGEHPCIGPKLR